ncbi:M16 family metallopeptidase [Chthonobacter rhizosphaerae]|uniref:M16 family metallopeptidase n=1 Tax=Chthonobacter rhizosphaerae TaxID=2735553 RepID=UPI0015EEA31E|nr:pitrilysin family protein [Chthonobacter rhizosphaerae]
MIPFPFRSARIRTAVAGAFLLVASALPSPAAATTVTEVVSPGGIKAWLVSDDAVPLVAMGFAFRGGASQDPAGKGGLANLMSGLLDEGAGDLDSAAFQRRLEETAVRIGFDADRDSFSGSLGTLSTRKDEAFDLLALALTRPRFDEEPLDRIRTQVTARIRSQQTDPETIASKLFAEATFPDHPYGRPPQGTEESVASITRDDLLAWHKAHIAKDNLVIGVVGDITAEELKPLLDRTFGGLPDTATQAPVADVVPRTGQRLTATLANPQTIIRFGAQGVTRDDPDFMAAYVVNHILGGGSFTSRLYEEVREKRGLAYSVWSAIATYDRAGVFLAGTSTRADQAPATVELMTEEIRRMAEEGPTEKELADAKTYLTGNYALRFDSSGKISQQLVGLQLDNLPIDYFTNRNALVEAVTLEDVKRAAKRILGSPLTVITVGPAEG